MHLTHGDARECAKFNLANLRSRFVRGLGEEMLPVVCIREKPSSLRKWLTNPSQRTDCTIDFVIFFVDVGAEIVWIMTHSATLFVCFSQKQVFGVRSLKRILICETEFFGVNVTLVDVADELDAAHVNESSSFRHRAALPPLPELAKCLFLNSE